MSLRRTVPLAFSPRGCTDALDTTDLPSGSMNQLRNLIPDPSTKNLWTCRPASTLLIDFAAAHLFSPWSSAWSTAFGPFVGSSGDGFVSALKVIGDRAYGLVSYAPFGTDIPFCVDIPTAALVAISGVTSTNTPTLPATSGAWTPPTVDLVGVVLTFTHPGFNTINGYVGWLDTSTMAWSSGNVSGMPFTVVPGAVRQFGQRAYYAINPTGSASGVQYTNVLDPMVSPTATPILTFGDDVPVTALGALGLKNLSGGITQSLIAFKGVTNMFQVTGDVATTNLAQNALNVAAGTRGPLTIAPTTRGLAFISDEGLRIIDFGAIVSQPIGDEGEGIAVPFVTAVQASRMVAAFGSDILRISVQNGDAVGTPNQEWWYDFSREVWSGPHDFPASQIQPYTGTFVVAPVGVLAKLFLSDTVPTSNSTYVENGTQLTYEWHTSMLPDTDQMAEFAMVETTIHMALAAGVPPIQVVAQDQDGNVFDTVAIDAVSGSVLWDVFQWDVDVWEGASNALAPRPVNWHLPIVFRRLSISVNGQSAGAAKVGRMHLRFEQLGYLQQ